MEKEFSKLCTPAKIYFVIAVIACALSLISGLGIVAVIVKLVFAFIWTFILSWLCSKGYKSLSWFLVLLPYVFILLAFLGLYHVTHGQTQILRTLHLQGAFGREGAGSTNNKQVPKVPIGPQ